MGKRTVFVLVAAGCLLGAAVATGGAAVADVPADCTIVGSEGIDHLSGTDGDDVICALGGNDTIYASPGNDTYIGGDGLDMVSYFGDQAGSGQTLDLLSGTGDGALGHETLVGVEDVQGSRYADTLRGDNNTYTDYNRDRGNSMGGGDGNDVLVGRGGNDELYGGHGNDVYLPGPGDDGIFDDLGKASSKFDKVSYKNAPGPVTVDLSQASGTGEGTDYLGNVEVVVGSRFADSITAGVSSKWTAFAFTLWGGAGPDTLVGQDARDKLYGQGGADNMTGGAGTDRCDGGADTDTATPDCETVVNVP